jgi:hypothetical protein
VPTLLGVLTRGAAPLAVVLPEEPAAMKASLTSAIGWAGEAM